MNPIKIIYCLLAVFVTIPIWLYLFYQVLLKVEATELMWFLFWIYVPVTLLIFTLVRLAEKE